MRIILDSTIGSPKSSQALSAPSNFFKRLITNKVTTLLKNSLCTAISCVSFGRPTAESRIILITVVALLCACSEQAAQVNKFGDFNARTYKNDFFNITISLPYDWFIQSEQSNKFLKDTGREILAGDDRLMNAAMKQAEKNMRTVFTLSKYEAGTPDVFNPTLICVVEDVSYLPGIKSEWDYISNMKSAISSAGIPYNFGNTKTIVLNGMEFVELHSTITAIGVKVKQIYRTIFHEGYVLSFIITYNNKKDRKELEEIFQTSSKVI